MIDNSVTAEVRKFTDEVHGREHDNEPFLIQGDFRVRIFEDGEVVHDWQKHNIIINSARKVMAHLIGDCGEGGSFDCINRFIISGSNTATIDELYHPIQPTETSSDLPYTTNSFERDRGDIGSGGEPLFTVTYPDAPLERSTLFSIKVTSTEANLMHPEPTSYLCAGLFSYDNDTELYVPFAMQAYPVIMKIPGREALFEWEIKF
jgi:hypothetical protein